MSLALYRLRLGQGINPPKPARRSSLRAIAFAILAINGHTVYIVVNDQSTSLISSNKWNKLSLRLLSGLYNHTADKAELVSRLRITRMSEEHLNRHEEPGCTHPRLTKRILLTV